MLWSNRACMRWTTAATWSWGKFRVLEGKTTLYRIDLCPLFLRHTATIDKELDSRWEATGFSLGNRTAAPEIGPPRGEQGGPINYSDAEYSGAGSASMLGAAPAWKGVAAELRSTALSYGACFRRGHMGGQGEGRVFPNMASASSS